MLALLGIAAAAQAKDQAIVVGINQYKDPAPAILKGPENDARDMAKFCRDHSYELTDAHFLIGERATKAAIMAALTDLANSVKDGDKVIFFFAGHGGNRRPAGKPDCFLLPYDYSAAQSDSGIGVDALYDAMKRIKTKANRTVILDSCFSGGMARPVDEFTSRNFVPYGSRSVVPVAPDEDQGHAGVPKTDDKDKICYLTAAKANEQALETKIDGLDHGLFTQALLPELAKNDTCEQTAANVGTKIKQIIRDKKSSRKQTPDVTPEYRNLLTLKESPALLATLPPPPPPKAVWDLIAKERPDPKKLTISVEPNQANVRVGQAVRLSVKVGAPGYLVVLWSKERMEMKVPGRSPNGAYELVKVEAGKEYPLYTGLGQTFTQPADNRVTALLFESPGPATSLVRALSGAPPTIEQLESQGLIDLDNGSKAYTTAGLTFQAGVELPGGYVVADGPGLLAALSKGGFKDPLSNYAEVVLSALEGDAKLPPEKVAQYVTLALNLALERLADDKEVYVGPGEPGLTPEGIAMVKETKTKLASATREEALVLNAKLLAFLMKRMIVEAKS